MKCQLLNFQQCQKVLFSYNNNGVSLLSIIYMYLIRDQASWLTKFGRLKYYKLRDNVYPKSSKKIMVTTTKCFNQV